MPISGCPLIDRSTYRWSPRRDPLAGSALFVSDREHTQRLINGCLFGRWFIALIGYARVSTVEQDEATQLAKLEALGVDPARIYVDHGFTSGLVEAPSFRVGLAGLVIGLVGPGSGCAA